MCIEEAYWKMLISENKSMVHVFERVSVSVGKRKSVSFGFTVRRPPSKR